jgi:hypothetical protein
MMVTSQLHMKQVIQKFKQTYLYWQATRHSFERVISKRRNNCTYYLAAFRTGAQSLCFGPENTLRYDWSALYRTC